jgi:hypothetical protein
MAANLCVEPAGSVFALAARRYESLLLLRLVGFAELIRLEAPALAADTGFDEAWAWFQQLPPGAVAAAMRVPQVDAWMRTARRLDAHGIHLRYPQAHPARHLKRFGSLMLAFIAHLPEGTVGTIRLTGERALLLDFGRGALLPRQGPQRGTLRLRRNSATLLLEQDARCLATIELGDQPHVQVDAADWSFEALPLVGPWIVDVESTAEWGTSGAAPGREALRARLGECLTSMCPQAVGAAAEVIRVVAPARSPASWTAGLMQVLPEHLDPVTIVVSAATDAVQRCVELLATEGPTSTVFGQHRPHLVELAARVLARRLLPSVPDLPVAEQREWDRMTHQLRKCSEGGLLLDVLGLTDGVRDVEQAEETAAEAAPRINDWSVLDVLTLQPEAAIVRDTPFERAAAAYVAGRFSECFRILANTLQTGPASQEHWHLLAFTARHLGWQTLFDRIVFQGELNPSELGRLANILP